MIETKDSFNQITNKVIETIKLQNVEFNLDEIDSLVQLIRHDQCKLTEFIFIDNKIPPDAMSSIYEALKQKITLKEFGLSGNKLGDESSAKDLGKFLSGNQTIKTLHLRKCGLNDISMLKMHDRYDLTSFHVEHLDLSLNKFGSLAIGYLRNSWTDRIKYFDLRASLCGEEKDQKTALITELSFLIKRLKRIQLLDLSENSVLEFSETFWSDTLKNNNSLVNLYLSFTDIELEAATDLAKAVANIKTFNTLELSGTRITDSNKKLFDEFLSALASNKNLTSINLNLIHLSKETLLKIPEFLAKNTHITFFRVEPLCCYNIHNDNTWIGPLNLSIEKELENNMKLTKLMESINLVPSLIESQKKSGLIKSTKDQEYHTHSASSIDETGITKCSENIFIP